MPTKFEEFTKVQLKQDLPDIRPGDTIRVCQKIKETSKKDKSSAEQTDKERIQVFEGQVIAKKHGKGIASTITVRKVISGVGVERIFPVHSPIIDKIEVIKREKARRAKLYYLRKAKGRKAKLKREEMIK
ncbi:MAG: 50S ribosomal protein L19 [Candidatus Nealsonbacteria bacterium]